MKLEITGINKSFPVNKGLYSAENLFVRACSDISISIESGGSLGIVGESGSGKTTLAKILAGFIEPDSGGAALDGIDLIKISRKKRSKLLQMVFQDPFASLNPKLILKTQLFESLKKIHKKDLPAAASKLLDEVGLNDTFLNRYPHQLSGGQRQRFAIARALSADPKLLLADEPVSSLDLSVQAQIINLLNKLRAEKKFTLVVVSHDLAVISNLCTQVVVMRDGLIVEAGSVHKILTQPQHEYTKQLLSAAPVV